MGSGMGMPSIGIYSYELYKFYDVDTIIRIGSCGAYQKSLKLYDTILVDSAFSESTYAKTQNKCDSPILEATKELNDKLAKIANEIGIEIKRGKIHSSDVFYREHSDEILNYAIKENLLGVEMESFALFHNAKITNKAAACLLTVSDSLVTNEATTAKERETAFTNMMKIALEMAE
jgi:purine-nucleoside phosphorylase